MGRTYKVIDADGHIDDPHADGFFPGAPALISRRTALSEATKSGILAGGAMRFYGLS